MPQSVVSRQLTTPFLAPDAAAVRPSAPRATRPATWELIGPLLSSFERAGSAAAACMELPGVLPPPVYTSRRTGEILAARFVAERPHIEVLDPHFADVYAELERLSDGVLATLSSDESGQRWIATFAHDRDPGVTWFYDHATGDAQMLFRAYPDRDPSTMAPMEPVGIPARDGLPPPGFLTLPVGVEPQPDGSTGSSRPWPRHARGRTGSTADRGRGLRRGPTHSATCSVSGARPVRCGATSTSTSSRGN